jgi:ADP-ribose pyrophosphatase
VSNLNWKTKDVEILLDSPWLQVASETCILPSGSEINEFYTLWQPDWVLIIATDPAGRYLLTKQYRHGTKCLEIEFPAGIVDSGEDCIAAAKRELQEECGYSQGEWSWLRSMPVNPDRHRGRFHIVRATNVICNGAVQWDPNESIELLQVDAEQLTSMIADGRVSHPHHVAAFYLASL